MWAIPSRGYHQWVPNGRVSVRCDLYNARTVKDQLLEFLRKAARYCTMVGAAFSTLAAAIEALVAIIGPGFGFGAA